MAKIEISGPMFSETTRIYASGIKYSGAKNVSSDPNPGSFNIVESQTQSLENPKIVVDNVSIENDSGSLTIANILDMYKHKYDGGNPIVLFIHYGSNNENTLLNFDKETTGINVVLEDFTIDLDTTSIRDAQKPVISLEFVETK